MSAVTWVEAPESKKKSEVAPGSSELMKRAIPLVQKINNKFSNVHVDRFCISGPIALFIAPQGDGSVSEDCEKMQAMTRDFFQNLYTSEGTANMSAVLDHVPSKVTDSMNTFQCAPFTEKEVKAT